MRSRCLLALLGSALLGAPLSAQQGEGGGAVVHMADGSSVPLTRATLSYEYSSWKQGAPQAQAQPQRRDTGSELWLAKKTFPLRGRSLEILYTPVDRMREQDGVLKRVKVRVASGVVIADAAGKTTPKLEPPHRDLILSGDQKGMLVGLRALDLKGETFTGTRREFCLLSFTALVECPDDEANQVVRVDFQ
jgi:hypothetical protein